MKKTLLIFFVLLVNFLWGIKVNDTTYQINGEVYIYQKPKLFDCITKAPGDIVDFVKAGGDPDNFGWMSLTAISTAAMIKYDEEITAEGRRWGKDANINDETSNTIGFPFLELPTDVGTGLYFIGDGAVPISLMAGFLTYGLHQNDNRALQTASELAEGMITAGLFSVQILKHTTGRTSPRANEDAQGVYRDKWRAFPSQVAYHQSVSHYDAFPSGHLATSMMTYTVITENYPEYFWVKPFGIALMTALSFQMVNNGVHWASDYPLAIVIGRVYGKLAVDKGRKSVKAKDTEEPEPKSFSILPAIVGNGYGLTACYEF